MSDRTLHIPPAELAALERSMLETLAGLPAGESALRARARVLLEQIRARKLQQPVGSPRPIGSPLPLTH
jgi:hypothetical protein